MNQATLTYEERGNDSIRRKEGRVFFLDDEQSDCPPGVDRLDGFPWRAERNGRMVMSTYAPRRFSTSTDAVIGLGRSIRDEEWTSYRGSS
jgi:hypothetical protein